MTNSEMVLGVDIGGSHVTAKLVDLEQKTTLNETEVREYVNAKASAADILTTWCGAMERSMEKGKTRVSKIGVAMPGPFDYANGIAWMQNQEKYDALYGLNLKELLAEKLNLLPQNIKFINDAESFLKGEVFSGAARHTSNVIGITLGTGLGSARSIRGITEDANLWCAPFLRGIAEDYLSTRWFVRRYEELSGKTISGVKELVALGEEPAQQVFDEFGKNLALFLSGDSILKDDPQLIVLGGNISLGFSRFSRSLNQHLKTAVGFPPIRRAMRGEEAALIGAASCWQEAPMQNVTPIEVK